FRFWKWTKTRRAISAAPKAGTWSSRSQRLAGGSRGGNGLSGTICMTDSLVVPPSGGAIMGFALDRLKAELPTTIKDVPTPPQWLLGAHDPRQRLEHLLDGLLVQLAGAEREVGDDALLDGKQDGDVGVAVEQIGGRSDDVFENAQRHGAG